VNESLTLAKNIVDTDYKDIPRHVAGVTKKSFLDAVGVMLAAGKLGEGCKEFVTLAIQQGGKKESTIVGFDAKVPACMAAFANGSMSHALDFEDTHDKALVHPNAAAIPAALAIAESVGNVSGKEFIAALTLGGDLAARLGLAVKENLVEYGWYMPPILEAFGATAAASKLLKLDAGQIRNAFSLTLCQATCSAELIYSSNSMIRGIRDAFSAKAGLLSALLAQKGITGFEHPFEGKAGLFNNYSRGKWDPLSLTKGLGKIFEGANVSFKPWPSCRGTHAYIDAALQILEEHPLKPVEIKEIHLTVNSMNKMLCEPLENKKNPVTAIEAKFSLPFTVATAVVHGTVTLDHFDPRALSDPLVLGLARKVSYRVDEKLGLKQATQGALRIETQDGRTYSKSSEFPCGHPDNPMSDEALVSKFMDCAKHSVKKFPKRTLNKVVELILSLEEIKDISEVTRYL
jgi:2-methylcitrate dehydratase PrpD